MESNSDICCQCKSAVDEMDKLQCIGEECKLIFHYSCSAIPELGYDTWGGENPFQYWKCLDCLEIEERKANEEWKKYDHKSTVSFKIKLKYLQGKIESLMEKYSGDKMLSLGDEDNIDNFIKKYFKILKVVEKMSQLEGVMGGVQRKIDEKYDLIKNLKMKLFLSDPWNLNEVSNEDSGSSDDNDDDWDSYSESEDEDETEVIEEIQEDEENENEVEELEANNAGESGNLEMESKCTQTDESLGQALTFTLRIPNDDFATPSDISTEEVAS